MSQSESSWAPRSDVDRVNRATEPSMASKNIPRNTSAPARVRVLHSKNGEILTGCEAKWIAANPQTRLASVSRVGVTEIGLRARRRNRRLARRRRRSLADADFSDCSGMVLTCSFSPGWDQAGMWDAMDHKDSTNPSILFIKKHLRHRWGHQCTGSGRCRRPWSLGRGFFL